MSELSDDCFHSQHSNCRHPDCSCSCHRVERLLEENRILRAALEHHWADCYYTETDEDKRARALVRKKEANA